MEPRIGGTRRAGGHSPIRPEAFVRHLVFTGLCIALMAAPSFADPRVWDQAWDVTPKPEVHVTAEDAHVRIHAGPVGKVTAHVEYELRRWGLIVGSSQPSVVFETRGDQVWITLRDPRTIGVIGGVDERFIADVTVPAEVRLTVRTGDGAIDCEPLTGTLTLQASDGAVRAHGLKGDIDVTTSDGRVVLDEIDGRLRVRTQDGRIIASGRFDAVDLVSSDGRVEATAVSGSQLESAWSVRTSDGGVRLMIPHDLAALLDARSREGRLHVELPIPQQGRVRRELVGELNGGGPALRVRSSGGSITLALSD